MAYRVVRAARKKTDTALRIAGRIQNKRYKAIALSHIAAALAQENPAQARVLCNQSLELLRQLPQEELVAREVIVALAAVDPERGLQMAAQLQDLDKGAVLKSVGATIARSGPAPARILCTKAMLLARGLKEQPGFLRAKGLADLAAGIARTDLPRARQIVSTLPDDYNRGEALLRVAISVAQIDLAQAKQLYQEIREIATKVENPDFQEILRERLVVQIAKTDPLLALALAKQIRTPHRVANTLAEIGAGFAKSDPGQSRKLFDQALGVAAKLAPELLKATVLGGIAVTLAASDPAHALQVTSQLSDRLGSDHLKREILVKVATIAAAGARTKPLHAEKLLKQAVVIAKGLKDPFADYYHRVMALGEVAFAFMEAAPTPARKLYEETAITTKALRELPYRAHALSKVAAAAAVTNDKRAMELLAPITEPRLLDYALTELVKLLV